MSYPDGGTISAASTAIGLGGHGYPKGFNPCRIDGSTRDPQIDEARCKGCWDIWTHQTSSQENDPT